MRALIATLVLSLVVDAAAQESSTIRDVSPAPPAPPASPGAPPAPPPPTLQAPSLQAPTLVAPAVVTGGGPSPEIVRHWRDARVVSVFGSILNVIGTGLSLASVIYIIATDYPPNAGSLLAPAAKPSDPGPALAYSGASASMGGFVLTATALGIEHRLLDQLGADPGRGVFGAGTAFGLVGILGVGASYFFGLTDYLNPHDQGVAILATSITGAALCGLGGILYAVDSSRVKRAWGSVTSF